MFCQKCGSKVEDGAQFCPGCGAKLAPVLGEPEAKPKSKGSFGQGIKSFFTKPDMRNWRYIVGIGVLIILVIVISVGISKSCRRKRIERAMNELYEQLLIPQQEFNFYWNYDMYSRTVSNFTFSNLTDYTMSEVCFYLNDEVFPFYTCSSLSPHEVLKFNRWQYKPKVTTEDAIKITCIIQGKTKLAIAELWSGEKQ